MCLPGDLFSRSETDGRAALHTGRSTFTDGSLSWWMCILWSTSTAHVGVPLFCPTVPRVTSIGSLPSENLADSSRAPQNPRTQERPSKTPPRGKFPAEGCALWIVTLRNFRRIVSGGALRQEQTPRANQTHEDWGLRNPGSPGLDKLPPPNPPIKTWPCRSLHNAMRSRTFPHKEGHPEAAWRGGLGGRRASPRRAARTLERVKPRIAMRPHVHKTPRS